MSLDDIVQVNITTLTKAPTRVGFGTPGILTHHSVFPEDFRIYTSATDMVTDGFTADQGATRIATAIFSQNPKVTQVVVGKRASAAVAMEHTITPIAQALTTYKAIINGTEFSFTSDASPTIAEITLGIETAITAGAEPVTATDNTTDIGLAADVAADTYRLQLTPANLWTTTETTVDAGISADIDAFIVANDDWYALHIDKHSKAEIVAGATKVETLIKLFGASSMDSDILTAVTTDTASTLKSSNFARTYLMYHSDANNAPGAAWSGVILPKDPGSATWKFKTLAGQLTDKLTATQETNAKGKNANHYQAVSGVSITQEGVTSSGEFIDVTRFVDFLRARIQEAVFAQLANLDKIPFTDPGIQIIESELSAVLQLGIDVGGLAADPEPTIIVPKAADVSFANKAARLLPDIEFTGTLAGAIHAVEIDGVVSV